MKLPFGINEQADFPNIMPGRQNQGHLEQKELAQASSTAYRWIQ
jgi:hypothetical protein